MLVRLSLNFAFLWFIFFPFYLDCHGISTYQIHAMSSWSLWVFRLLGAYLTSFPLPSSAFPAAMRNLITSVRNLNPTMFTVLVFEITTCMTSPNYMLYLKKPTLKTYCQSIPEPRCQSGSVLAYISLFVKSWILMSTYSLNFSSDSGSFLSKYAFNCAL